MRLRDTLRSASSTSDRTLFERFGVTGNPFPPASQPMGHPRLITDADTQVEGRIVEFVQDQTTVALVIEGTQGTGKTNLLEYYRNELEAAYKDEPSFYIIKYYPGPESEFSSIVKKIFLDLGVGHLERLGRAYKNLSEERKRKVLDQARSQEVQSIIEALGTAADDEELHIRCNFALDYFLGSRVFKAHKEHLNVILRLDTTEAKTRALRDLVYCSRELDCLKAVFLFLDELEKQDGVQSKTVVVRYLSAIRALIDALPFNLFLLLAMTTDARLRYARMLPALAGRLRHTVELKTLQSDDQAVALYRFY